MIAVVMSAAIALPIQHSLWTTTKYGHNHTEIWDTEQTPTLHSPVLSTRLRGSPSIEGNERKASTSVLSLSLHLTDLKAAGWEKLQGNYKINPASNVYLVINIIANLSTIID